jgi:hypothetical protein
VLIESVRQRASYFGLPISEFVAIIGNCNFNRCHGWRPSKTRLVQSQTIAAITRRSNTPLRGWTVCKSRLCGFASQKYSTTHNLQTAVVLNVRRSLMSKSIKICKSVDQLQPEDIELYPIWEFALDEEGNDEQDETWVRPIFSKVVELNQFETLLLRTSFYFGCEMMLIL